MRRTEFHQLAFRELIEAAQFYELESPGLGSSFLDEVQRCLGSIVKHPEAGMVIRGKVRRRLVRRFPFGLLYRVGTEGIRVLAVMNLRRRPTSWVRRR